MFSFVSRRKNEISPLFTPSWKNPPTPIFGRLPLLTMETTFFSYNSFMLAIAIFV